MTEYMCVNERQAGERLNCMEVDGFKYLGSTTESNRHTTEVKKRMQRGWSVWRFTRR